MNRELALYESRWRAMLWFAPFGLFVGVFQYAVTGSIFAGVFQGVFGFLFFGPIMRRIARRFWPGGSGLDSSDRAAVVGVVRTGAQVRSAQLAPAVLDYLAVVRRAQDRDRRYRWALGLVAVGTALLAITASVDGSARSAVAWWVMVALWIVILGSMPRRQRRILSHASAAEVGAQRALRDS